MDAAGTPLEGAGEVRFRLYTAATAGVLVNGAELTFAVTFEAGRFTVSGLDFGAGAYGTGNEARWLEIDVKEPGGTVFTTLSPRQRLSQTPFAAVAGKALQVDASGLSGTLSAGFVNSNGLLTSTGTQTISGTKMFANPANIFTGNGSGLTSVTAQFYHGAIVDGQLGSNVALLNRGGQVFSVTNRFTQNVIVDGRLGVGTITPSAPLSIATTQQQAMSVVSSSTGGTWFDFANSASGGRTWNLIATGPALGEGTGHFMLRNASASTVPVFINGTTGAVGVGTLTPGAGYPANQLFDKFEVAGPDVGLRVRNVNDSVGGLLWNSFGAFHFGMYNPGALQVGQIPPQARRAFFSVTNSGQVGSTTNTGGSPIFRNYLDDGFGHFIVRTNGSMSGNHVALFENTGANNADGIAIKINNAQTNSTNNFVTFIDGLANVAGRIEGFDFENFDWIAPPPALTLNMRANITLNPSNTWFNRGSFSPGAFPTLTQTQAPIPPSLSTNTANIAGINVLVPPINFNSGAPALYGLSGGTLPSATLPSITGNVFNIGNPALVVDLPTQQQMNDLVCWGLQYGTLETLGSMEVSAAYTVLQIQATQSCKDGGVTYGSKGADYAEYLERANPKEDLNWAEVVGVRGGRISRDTQGAEQIMVISRAPIVLGNQPSGDASNYEKVAFMGQVPVLVRGPVNAGDYLIASGLNDGSAVAVGESQLTTEHLSRLVGRAWEGARSGSPLNLVNTAIGINPQAARHVLERQESELAQLRQQLSESKVAQREVEDRLTSIERLLNVKGN